MFFIISMARSIVLSEKYGEITLNIWQIYYDIIGPNSIGYPPTEYAYQGFIKPPYERVTSVWYDHTFFKIDSWSPFES